MGEKTGEALPGEFAESRTHPRRHGKLSKSALHSGRLEQLLPTSYQDPGQTQQSDVPHYQTLRCFMVAASWSFPA
jgi:hypothetical protein